MLLSTCAENATSHRLTNLLRRYPRLRQNEHQGNQQRQLQRELGGVVHERRSRKNHRGSQHFRLSQPLSLSLSEEKYIANELFFYFSNDLQHCTLLGSMLLQ